MSLNLINAVGSGPVQTSTTINLLKNVWLFGLFKREHYNKGGK